MRGINGVQENSRPTNRVDAMQVIGALVTCKIQFENTAIPTITGNVTRTGNDATFSIYREANGSYGVKQVTVQNTTNGVIVSGTTSSGNTTSVTTNNGYVENVKSGSVEATDHSVKTDKFSVSSNVSVKVKTPGLPGGGELPGGGQLPSMADINAAQNAMGAYNSSTNSTTTTTTTTTSSSNTNTIPKGIFTFESEGVDSFYLWFNTVKINETPQMYVVVRDVVDTYLNLRVEFSDRSNKPCSKSMMRWGRDCYYSIGRNNKGEHVIKLKNAVGDLKSPAPETTQTTQTVYTTQAPATFTFISMQPTTVTASITTNSSNSNTVAVKTNAVVNTSSAQPVATGPLKAETRDGKIFLNDGRTFKLNSFAGNSEAPHIKATILQGAKATLTWDDGLDGYAGVFPFDYAYTKPEKYKQFFTLTVDEGGPDKTWSVKLQSGSWHWLNIEP